MKNLSKLIIVLCILVLSGCSSKKDYTSKCPAFTNGKSFLVGDINYMESADKLGLMILAEVKPGRCIAYSLDLHVAEEEGVIAFPEKYADDSANVSSDLGIIPTYVKKGMSEEQFYAIRNEISVAHIEDNELHVYTEFETILAGETEKRPIKVEFNLEFDDTTFKEIIK